MRSGRERGDEAAGGSTSLSSSHKEGRQERKQKRDTVAAQASEGPSGQSRCSQRKQGPWRGFPHVTGRPSASGGSGGRNARLPSHTTQPCPAQNATEKHRNRQSKNTGATECRGFEIQELGAIAGNAGRSLTALASQGQGWWGAGEEAGKTLALRYRRYLVVFTICVDDVVHFHISGRVSSGEPAMT